LQFTLESENIFNVFTTYKNTLYLQTNHILREKFPLRKWSLNFVATSKISLLFFWDIGVQVRNYKEKDLKKFMWENFLLRVTKKS